ncbi:MAG: signal peptidase II, partial [Chloroflexi bacterium]|nr:signal peptidase II [Chloroflexota bacterium]
LGNFVDRVRQGYVVDFLDAGIGALRWPAFNVADAAFVVGTAVLAFYLMRTGETQERRGPETATGSADGGGGAA